MNQALKHDPYGIASYETLREFDFAYVDKTPFIKVLEEEGPLYTLIIRPRRFGKSLFANTLMAYYDKAAACDFEKNFTGTWIGEHPTPLASQYLILKFDFSGIDCDEHLVQHFIQKIKLGMTDFAMRYLEGNDSIFEILDAEYSSPSALLLEFLGNVEYYRSEKIYLIIDEYDHFVQQDESSDPNRLNFLRAFFANIKNLAQSTIGRIYITGVTPVSLDSFTSGFNIATDISDDIDYAGMLGFTGKELRALIPQVLDIEQYGATADAIFERMKNLFHGYRFCPYSDVTVFNPIMCFHYLSELRDLNHEPDTLLDPNFAYGITKIDAILTQGKKEFVKQIVRDIIFDKPIACHAVSQDIRLSKPEGLSYYDMLSALVCLGFLTLSPADPHCWVCPNILIKKLFIQYWFARIEKLEDVSFTISDKKEAIAALTEGDIRPLLLLASKAIEYDASRRAGVCPSETAIPLAVALALNGDKTYRVSTEEDAFSTDRMVLILRPAEECPDAAGWLVTFKYIQNDAVQEDIYPKVIEAFSQLIFFSGADTIIKIPHLHRVAAVFSGTKLKALEDF